MTQTQSPEPAGFPFAKLKRWPDVEATNLLAHDASDRLILDMAAPALSVSAPGDVAVLGDRYGALTLGAIAVGARQVRVHQDSYSGRLALDANAQTLASADLAPKYPDNYRHCDLGAELLTGAKVVLMQLPKDLAQLSEWSRLIATHADPSVQVFAGGRVKHMTLSMNGVFSTWFWSVTASRARQKSRVLVVAEPREDVARAGEDAVPDEVCDPELDLWVCSYPGVFAAGKVDIGTRFFVPFVEEEVQILSGSPAASSLVAADLGCGTGVLAAAVLRSAPEALVVATDRSEVAVRSTRATLARNVLGPAEVLQDDGLSQQPENSVDLIVCNPPFHSEAGISTALSEQIFQGAARALKPGGVMLTVFNSHLRHRSLLERLIGPTEQLGRNAKFTVTRSVKRA